jgi:nucleoside-diphosphate kinase
MERTLVILKPSAIQRGLVGEILTRFEKVGLKMAGAKLIWPDKDLLDKHYPPEREEFVTGLGQRTLDSYKELGLDVKKQFEELDPNKIGHEVRDWLVQSMMSGPVMPIVLEGPHSIEIVRKIVGHTLPQKAAPGTVRGDYSFDSAALANKNQRPVNNLIHASGNAEEAEHEIELWFTSKELHEYATVHQKHMSE